MRTSLHHEKNCHTGGRTMATDDDDDDDDDYDGDGATGDEVDDDGDDNDYGDGRR